MQWLDKAEKFWRPYAIPGLTLYLVAGQFLCFVLQRAQPSFPGRISLIPSEVLSGEVWRLFSFVLDPGIRHPIFMFFFWYLFYLMGDALESQWGVARYNIFLLIAWLATVAAAFLNPASTATNFYLLTSVFLAFAYLHPDFQILVMFVLPIRVKWLALLTWISYGFTLMGGSTDRYLVLASISSYLLFFGRDLLLGVRSRHQRMERRAQEIKREHEPIHRCVACGVTDKADPAMEFRYCSKCADAPCYCRDHIRNHTHRVADAVSEGPEPTDVAAAD